MTNDEDKVIFSNKDFTFTVDDGSDGGIADKICDTCNANSRAATVGRLITTNMTFYHKIAEKESIEYPIIYLDKQLKKLQKKYIAEYMQLIEMPKYEFWRKRFIARVEALTQHLSNMPDREDYKKNKVAY